MAADPKAIADFTSDLNPVSGSELGRGISRGILQVGEGLAGFGEIFADLVGADSAKAWLKTQGGNLAELSANIPRAVQNFTEIRDLPSLGAYTAAAIGELVPQIAVSLGAGLAARGAATGATALLRGAAGAGAASYVQEAGGIYRGVREETGQEAPKTTLAFGAPAAALDLLTPARFLGKVFDSATDELKSKAWGSLVKRSFSEAAKAAPIEGLTESAQEAIAISANRFADQTYDVVNGKNFIRVLDAGISGIIGGAMIGGAEPVAERYVKSKQEVSDATLKRDQQQGEGEKSARDVQQLQTEGTAQRTSQFDSGLLRSPASQQAQAPLASMGPETSPTFYSRLQRTVETSPQQKASGAQWKATIKQSKLGANADEMALVGVDSLEDSKPYTKAEVLGFLRDNEIQVKEVTLGQQQKLTESEKSEMIRLGLTGKLNPTQKARYDELNRKELGTPTHYSQYQLGGGEEGTYREWVLHVPGLAKLVPPKDRVLTTAPNGETRVSFTDGTHIATYPTRERAIAAFGADGIEWKDGHSSYNDIPNPVVRLRGAIHTTTDGKRMLLIEEVQAPQKGEFEKMPALFQAKWRDIGFKFALRKAAELGVDQLGWTTGKQQAERYSLSKQISSEGLKWSAGDSARGALVFTVAGETADTRKPFSYTVGMNELESVVGKDISARIQSDYRRGVQSGTIQGDDLSIGGEGLTKLYDIDFRNVVNSLPSVKKAGVKVGTADLSTNKSSRPSVGQGGNGRWQLTFRGRETISGFPTEQAAIAAIPIYEARFAAQDWDRGDYTVDENLYGGFDVINRDIDELSTRSVVKHFESEQDAKALAAELNRTARKTVHSIPIPESLRASVLEGQPLASVGQRGQIRGIPVDRVKAGITPLAAQFGVNVEVLKTPPADLGPEFAGSRGMVYADGRAQLFAENIPPGTDPNELFFHEIGVHLGLEVAAKTPAQQRELASILGSVAPRLMRKADEIARRDGFTDFNALAKRYGWDMATPAGRQRSIAELLGREAQRYAAMKTPPSWWRSLIGKLKAFLGRIFKFDIGDDGVYAIVTKGLSRAGQAQRGAVAAPTTQPPLASLGPTLTARDLEKTLAFTPQPAIREAEAIMASGQVTDILGMFRRWIEQIVPTAWRTRVQGITEFQRLGGINDFIADTLMIDPRTFVQAKAQMPNDGMRTLMDLHLSNGMNYVEARALAVKQNLESQRALVESPGMRQKIVNAMSHLERSNVAEDSKRRIVSQIKNGIVRAQRRARESGGNQAVFDEAQEQLRFYESLLTRVPELQAAVDAIINTIALDPQSVEGVMGGVMPNEATLLRNHLAVTARPESTTDSLGNRRNEGLALLRVAANIISRSQQLARKALASQWAEDSEVSREASDLESRIRQSVDTGTMRQELDRALRSVASLATAAGKAAAVFRIRQRFIVRAFDRFTNLQYANQVFDAVLASPEYRALRNAVGAATGERIVPTAAKGVALESAFRSKHVVVMPDGTARDFTMAPDRKTWEEQMADTNGRRGIETTISELRAWIDDPANENDPTRPFYESQVRDLEYLWHGSFVYDSPKIYPAFRRFHFKTVDAFLKQFDSLVTNIGIRGASSLRTIASVMKDSMHLFGDWMTKSDPVYTRAMIEGAKSHADIWSAQTPVNAIDLWYDEVLNPLFASHQDPARPGYRTGEVIPESGRKVTAQDTAARIQMARLSKQSHEIDAVQNRMAVVPSVLVEDTMVPGAPHHRRAMTISEGQVPRRMSRKAIDLVSQYLKSEELKQDRFAFWDVPHRFFDVKSMVANRDAQHSTVSDFEDAFQEVKTELQRGLADSEITDLQSMIGFIEERVDSEPNEVRDFILAEMDRHVRAVASAVDALRAQVIEPPSKAFGTTSVKPVDRTTSFTTGRGRAIAPPWAYEYGWRDTRAIMDYAMSGNSFYVELFIKTLLSAADELRTYQKNVISPRIAALEKQHGDKQKAREVWLSENRENLRLGNELVEWERVDDFANSLEAYARSFNEQYSVGGKEVDVRLAVGDRVLSRFVTGVLFGWGTTVRNALEGGFVHNGIRLSRLSGGVFGAFPKAGFSVAKVILPMAWRAFPAAIKGAWKTARNLPRAVRTLATTGNLVKAEGQLLADAIETMATSLMGQSELARGLDRRGLGLPVLPKAVLENQAELWRTSGQIRPAELSANPVLGFLQSTAQYGATFIDANLALFAKPFFPRVGDVIANQAVADTTFSAIRQLEKRLKILHRTMRDAGMDTSNLGNRQFTPNEVLGRYFGFDRTTTALRELEGLFIDAQLDFHKSIAEWFQRLDRIGPDQRWLTDESLWRLAMRNVEVINAPTALNRALAIKKNIATRTIGALLGWNLSAYRKYADYIGRSTRDDKTVFRVRLAVALWIFAMLNMAGASNEAIELIMRRIAELFGDPARATRVPWEFDKPSDALKSHAIYAFNTVPFVATAVNAAFNDMPNKASLSPYLLLQNKVLDIVNYIGGAVNSGDPLYKLPQLVRGFVPLSSVVINRLPEIAGMREATSVARLYTRYGDKEDLAKPFARSGPGASASVTALSPYGDRITSALLRGDDQEAAALYTQAIEVAKRIGKLNPEASVKSLVINRLPISRAFKSTPSAADYSQLLSRMSAGDRARVERFNATATVGLAKLGITTEKIRPLAPVRTAGGTRGRTARNRSGFRTSRIRRVRLGGSRSRSRLGTRRRRNGLVRSASN